MKLACKVLAMTLSAAAGSCVLGGLSAPYESRTRESGISQGPAAPARTDRRPALLLAAVTAIGAFAAPAHADDVSGPWRVTGKFAGIAFVLNCDLKADGARLGGVCVEASSNGSKTNIGKSHVLTAGSVNGDRLSWSYAVHYLVNQFDVTFNGVRSGNRIVGAIDLKGHGGTFTATRP
jgi:hypothetical protein